MLAKCESSSWTDVPVWNYEIMTSQTADDTNFLSMIKIRILHDKSCRGQKSISTTKYSIVLAGSAGLKLQIKPTCCRLQQTKQAISTIVQVVQTLLVGSMTLRLTACCCWLRVKVNDPIAHSIWCRDKSIPFDASYHTTNVCKKQTTSHVSFRIKTSRQLGLKRP